VADVVAVESLLHEVGGERHPVRLGELVLGRPGLQRHQVRVALLRRPGAPRVEVVSREASLLQGLVEEHFVHAIDRIGEPPHLLY